MAKIKLIEKLKSVCDVKLLKFLLVGVVNTLVGSGVMFLAYNVFHCSYWLSSALNYIIGSVLSYFLNKYFTFQYRSRSVKTVVKFVINILVCYLLAYGIAKPLAALMLSGVSVQLQENGAMLAGMCLFVLLNYFGQRFFAFREENEKPGKQ